MDRRQEPFLDDLVVAAEHGLERRDHVADDVFRRIMQARGEAARITASTSSVCCATEKMWAPLVWPFQRATRASPWAMSAISMSSGEGSSKSSRRPDNIRCQARSMPVGS